MTGGYEPASEDMSQRTPATRTPFERLKGRFESCLKKNKIMHVVPRTPFEARFNPSAAKSRRTTFERRRSIVPTWKVSTTNVVREEQIHAKKMDPRRASERRIDQLIARFTRALDEVARTREGVREREIHALQEREADIRERRESEIKKREKKVEELDVSKRPLDEKEVLLVHEALGKGPMGQVLATHERTNLEVTRSDFECMKPGQWLNDEVINFYIALLQDRDTRRKSEQKGPRCFFFNTFFYHKLRSGGYSYRGVSRWSTAKRLKQQGVGYESILECDKIIVPIHQPAHWTMAVINLRDQQLEYYDSLGGADSEVLDLLSRYIEDEAKDKQGKELDTSGWMRLFARNIPRQMNGSDCGVFAIKYGEYCSRDAGFQFSQEDMPYFRQRIVADVMRRSVD